MPSQISDLDWELRKTVQRLSTLLNTVENLECFTHAVLSDGFSQAYDLLCIGSELAKSAEMLSEKVSEAIFKLEHRLSNPEKSDRFPGELLLDLLKVVNPQESAGEGSAQAIAMKASRVAQYAKFDSSMKPALDYLMELIRRQGYTTKLAHYEDCGYIVEISRSPN